MSKGEEQIIKILKKERISFVREKVIDAYRNKKLRFDFYLPNVNNDVIAIEVNGLQHYEYTSYFYKNYGEFRHSQANDSHKISYCLANGIKIYCIPYWELNKIKTFRDITQDKFLAKDRYHNYNVYREYQKIFKR